MARSPGALLRVLSWGVVLRNEACGLTRVQSRRPGGQPAVGISPAVEDLRVQACVPQAAFDAWAGAVPMRIARGDGAPCDPFSLAQFRMAPVVNPALLSPTMQAGVSWTLTQASRTRAAPPKRGGFGDQRPALLAAKTVGRQKAEIPGRSVWVRADVGEPALVRPPRGRDRRGGSECPLAHAMPAHVGRSPLQFRQSFLLFMVMPLRLGRM